MLPRYSFIALVTMLTCLAQAMQSQDTLIISPRVGKVLDTYECRYFGLFREVAESNGIAFLTAGASVIVANGGVQIMRIDPGLVPLLASYINEYDSLLWHLRDWGEHWELNDRFESLHDAKLVKPFERREKADIEILVRGNNEGQVQTHEGVLIWADEHMLIVRPEDESSSQMSESIFAASDTIHPGDITAISIYEGTAPGKGLAYGVLIGGGLGVVIGLGRGTQGHSQVFESDFLVAITLLGATTFGVVGLIIGGLTSAERQTEIRALNEYHIMLPKLRARMIYAKGLPPELR